MIRAKHSAPMKYVKIDFLANAPHCLDTISLWLNREYLYLNPGETIEMRKQRMLMRMNVEKIPFCMVALIDNIPVSTASIIECDLSIRSEFTPWLASVYTEETHRNKGIGSLLCATMIDTIKCFNKYKNVYLYTPDKKHFYEYLGWIEQENIFYMSKNMSVMSISLT